MQALFGTRMSADINMVAQLLLLAGLWVGFYFARTGRIPYHRNTQTTMVLANLFFIAFVMATSLYRFVIQGSTTTGTVASLMMVHGGLGTIAEASGIYLILRMRTQIVPRRLLNPNRRPLPPQSSSWDRRATIWSYTQLSLLTPKSART